MQDKLVYPQNEMIQSKMSLMPSLRHAGLESKDTSFESIIRVNKRGTKYYLFIIEYSGISLKTKKLSKIKKMFYLEISSWYDCRQFQLKKYVRSIEELSAIGRISVIGIIWRHYACTWKKWLKILPYPEMLVRGKNGLLVEREIYF